MGGGGGEDEKDPSPLWSLSLVGYPHAWTAHVLHWPQEINQLDCIQLFNTEIKLDYLLYPACGCAIRAIRRNPLDTLIYFNELRSPVNH